MHPLVDLSDSDALERLSSLPTGSLVTLSRVWPGRDEAWITAGDSSKSCTDRDIHVLMRRGDEALRDLYRQIHTRMRGHIVALIEPLHIDLTRRDRYTPTGDLYDTVQVANVDIFRARYRYLGNRRQIWWCRHCLSLANEAPFGSIRKIQETDCSVRGAAQLCRSRAFAQRFPRLRFASSNLRRSMRTAMALSGAQPRATALACIPDPERVPIRIYPELKEHLNPLEDVLRFVMPTLNSTTIEHTEDTRLALNREYTGAELQAVRYTPGLRAVAQKNEPDYGYFLKHTLFREPALRGDPTLIVSHGYFLKTHVLGRYEGLVSKPFH